MNKNDEPVESHSVFYLTTLCMAHNLAFIPESSDGFIVQGSWMQFVRRALSRQTKSQNSTNLFC